MNLTEVYPGIFHAHYKKWRTLVRAFLRFQEHYESPIFKGKIFSHEEHKREYTKVFGHAGHEGDFGYFGWWGGFNFPSSALKPFLEGRFNPLSKEELAALRVFRRIPLRDYYAIGTNGQDSSDLEHELAHGFFHQSEAYKQEVTQAVQSEPSYMTLMNLWLKEGGYHPDVFLDEMQAYAIYPDLPDQLVMSEEEKQIFAKTHEKTRPIFDRYRLQLLSSQIN